MRLTQRYEDAFWRFGALPGGDHEPIEQQTSGNHGNRLAVVGVQCGNREPR